MASSVEEFLPPHLQDSAIPYRARFNLSEPQVALRISMGPIVRTIDRIESKEYLPCLSGWAITGHSIPRIGRIRADLQQAYPHQSSARTVACSVDGQTVISALLDPPADPAHASQDFLWPTTECQTNQGYRIEQGFCL